MESLVPGGDLRWCRKPPAQLQRSLARSKSRLRSIQTSSRLGLSASRGSEYSRLGSRRRSRRGSKPLRFFCSTPSRVPLLPEDEEQRGEEEGKREGKEQRKD